MRSFEVHSLDELGVFAQELSGALVPGDVVLLFGEMGVGKTTLVSLLARALHATSGVSSPTFTLLQRYAADIELIHMDLYRLHSEADILDIDLEWYLSKSAGIVLIEWPERLGRLRPEKYVKISLSYLPSFPEYRHVTIEEIGGGNRW
jgi:tRNA threonylcarbamoyladenosine biosynthesis protein TsaE